MTQTYELMTSSSLSEEYLDWQLNLRKMTQQKTMGWERLIK